MKRVFDPEHESIKAILIVTGTVFIKNLRTSCIIGINEAERSQPIEVVINAEMENDISLAARTDEINNAVDYLKVGMAICEQMTRGKYHLVETAVEECAQLIFEMWAPVTRLTLSIEKPNIVPGFEAVGVRITRTRPS